MRALRPGTRITGALSALIVCAAGAGAQGLDPYPVTLYYGTGLVTTPVAWVSPTNADLRVASTGKRLPYYVNPDAHNFATRWNTNLALETHWLGRFTVGASLYSQNPEYGFFGRLLLLREGDLPFLPAVAIGLRNLGQYDHEDRFKIGHDISLQDTTGGQGWEEEISDTYRGFSTAPTFYAVATKSFQFAGATRGTGLAGMSINVGWGNGLFQDDAGLGDLYNESGTLVEGLFLGTRLTMHPTLNTTVHVVAENDAWDWNAGVVGDWRGLSLGVYATEIEEGSREENGAQGFHNVYNYTKWNVSLGYSGNIIDISRGVILRTAITELTREAQRLRMEIAERERHIAALEVTLRRAQAGELADIEQRRRELEAQIQQEQEQIRRATERLQEIERQRQAPPPPPPPTTPPSSDRTTPSL
jgi:hypothetical protein